MPTPDLLPPRERRSRSRFLWQLGSAAVHVLAIFALVSFSSTAPVRDQAFPGLVRYVQLAQAPQQHEIPARPSTGQLVLELPVTVPTVERAPAERPALPPPPAAAPVDSPVSGPSVFAPVAPGSGTARPSTGLPPRSTADALRPGFGDGRLWVPAVGIESDPGAVLSALNRFAELDSALASQIIVYLDTVPPDSFATGGTPDWLIEIGGEEWGIGDDGWIHLGPIKIPAAVLALLPLPGGNYDQARAERRLQQIRNEIMRQARTIEDRELFDEWVDELRRRREEERRREQDEEEEEPEEPEGAVPVS